MKKLFLLFIPLLINAQDVPIGYWKDYQSYSSASYMTEADNKVYCVTNGGLFYINKDDKTINRMSKVTGLSDIGIKHVAYSKALKIIVITYENCNIDLIKNNQIINISDVKRKEITGLKLINNITLKDGTAYLSCTFGLVLIDLEKEEVKDTYELIENEYPCAINNMSYSLNSIYLSTSCGGFYADINSLFLNDFSNWNRETISREINDIYYSETSDTALFANAALGPLNNTIDIVSGDNIESYNCAEIVEITFINNKLHRIYSDKIIISNGLNLIYSDTIYHEKIEKAQFSFSDSENIIWVADSINGILKFGKDGYIENPMCEGPKENNIFSLEFLSNKLYACHGGHINFGPPPGSIGNKNGASVMSEFDIWKNYDYYDLNNAKDIVEVAEYNGVAYFASYYNGIVEVKDDEVINRYTYENTGGVLDIVGDWQDDKRNSIADLKFDNFGNMWGLVSRVKNPLFVKTKNDEWYNFPLSPTQQFHFDEILIDQYNQKWGIMGRKNGLFVFTDNNTISNTADDQYKLLNMSIGNGNLPSLDVYCFAEDLDGEIWVGTDKGIGVFYNPSSVFSDNNFDAQQILITEGEYGQYLLSEEKVKCITIDGANRKWIGTEKAGIFLLSEDGVDEVLHFTSENSPLFSNNIIDIAINPNNGEVFIGTEKGLMSYRSDATIGSTIQSKTKIFPNPVRETYNGMIAISGLITDANIKITDINSNLVFEGFAKGGQASWNGKNKNGEKVSTGIYLVFSTDTNGIEKIVSKILFIH
tara:strand:+ start:943 stop:3231 length:2289 start_codon:yes stop_codon:yes gene_type:complete